MSGLRVHASHARAARLDGERMTCAPGIRTWCKRYGVDLHRLCHEGIPIEDLAHLREDPFVQRAIAFAQAEEQARAL